eukprot:scaffold898_cov229-Pinguiococcus_pyrenoidosus.AAC.4
MNKGFADAARVTGGVCRGVKNLRQRKRSIPGGTSGSGAIRSRVLRRGYPGPSFLLKKLGVPSAGRGLIGRKFQLVAQLAPGALLCHYSSILWLGSGAWPSTGNGLGTVAQEAPALQRCTAKALGGVSKAGWRVGSAKLGVAQCLAGEHPAECHVTVDARGALICVEGAREGSHGVATPGRARGGT